MLEHLVLRVYHERDLKNGLTRSSHGPAYPASFEFKYGPTSLVFESSATEETNRTMSL